MASRVRLTAVGCAEGSDAGHKSRAVRPIGDESSAFQSINLIQPRQPCRPCMRSAYPAVYASTSRAWSVMSALRAARALGYARLGLRIAGSRVGDERLARCSCVSVYAATPHCRIPKPSTPTLRRHWGTELRESGSHLPPRPSREALTQAPPPGSAGLLHLRRRDALGVGSGAAVSGRRLLYTGPYRVFHRRVCPCIVFFL